MKINGKALYSPNGAAREYGRVGCNLYTGCPHDCAYCYLKRGVLSHAMGSTNVRLKSCFSSPENAFEVFCREVDKYEEHLKETGIFFSFSTDPLIKETRELTEKCVKYAVEKGIKVQILTKNADFIKDTFFGIWAAIQKTRHITKMVSFGFTLTGRDDMEKGAPGNDERIEAMRYLNVLGYRTFASIEPVIDWESSRRVIEQSLDCCDHYKIGLRSGVPKNYYNTEESCRMVKELTALIVKAGHTVYLKKSIRELLVNSLGEEKTEELLALTVDMDGKPHIKQ